MNKSKITRNLVIFVVGCVALLSYGLMHAGDPAPVAPPAQQVVRAPAREPSVDCGLVREYSSCAVGYASLVGRLTAGGISCQYSAERLLKIGAVAMQTIQRVVRDESDRAAAMLVMKVAGEETVRRRQAGLDREPCQNIRRALDDVAAKWGLM